MILRDRLDGVRAGGEAGVAIAVDIGHVFGARIAGRQVEVVQIVFQPQRPGPGAIAVSQAEALLRQGARRVGVGGAKV